MQKPHSKQKNYVQNTKSYKVATLNYVWLCHFYLIYTKYQTHPLK